MSRPLPHKTDSTDPMQRLYTAEEVIAALKAVVQYERGRAVRIARLHQSKAQKEVERYG